MMQEVRLKKRGTVSSSQLRRNVREDRAKQVSINGQEWVHDTLPSF